MKKIGQKSSMKASTKILLACLVIALIIVIPGTASKIIKTRNILKAEMKSLSSEILTEEENKELDKKLRKELDEILKEKNFVEQVNEYIISGFNDLCENYESWKEANPDLPDKETYIREVLSCVSEVNDIKLNRSLGMYISANTDYKKNIRILPGLDNGGEVIIHEIKGHIKESNDEETFVSHNYFEPILKEGGATLDGKFTRPYSTETSTISDIRYGEEYRVAFKVFEREGYGCYYNLYNILEYLVGYRNVCRAKTGNRKVKKLIKIVSEKYGEEMSEKIFHCFKLIKECKDWEPDENEWVETNLELQKLFSQILENDIKNSKGIKELKRCRFYANQNNIYIKDNDHNDLTKDFFDIDAINKLIDKKESRLKRLCF